MTDGSRTSQHPMTANGHGAIRRRRRRVSARSTLLLLFLLSGSVSSEIEKIEDAESSSSHRPTVATTTTSATATEIRAETTSKAPSTRTLNDDLVRITGVTERTFEEATAHDFSTSLTSPQPIVEGSTEETSALENTIGPKEKEPRVSVTQSTFRIVDNTPTPDKFEDSTLSLTVLSTENKATSADEYDLNGYLTTTEAFSKNEVSSTSFVETEPRTEINGDETRPSSRQPPTTPMTLIQSNRSVPTTSSPNLTVASVSTTPSTTSQLPSSLSSSPVTTSTYVAPLSSTIEYEFIGLKENTIPPEYSARSEGENATSSTNSQSSFAQSTTEKEISASTTMMVQPSAGQTTTAQPFVDPTATEQPTVGPTTIEVEEASGVTTMGETTGVTTTEGTTEYTKFVETSEKIMDENTESMMVGTMTEETTINGESATEVPTEIMQNGTTDETEMTMTVTSEEMSNETTGGTTYWTMENATTEGNTEESVKQEEASTEKTTEPITHEITTESEKIDYTPEDTTARIINTTDRNVYINIPISRGTVNPGELTPLVKIIFEGTWMEVCPHLPGLRQSLADLLALAVKRNVHVGQIVYQNNPCGNGTDAPVPSSSTAQQLITTESSVTSLFLYVVDKDGNLDVEMTKMLPRVFRESSAKLRVTIHSFQLVQEADSGNAIAVIIVSCVALLCLVLLTGLLLVVTSRRTRFNYGERCRPVSLDAYSLDSVSAYNSVRGRKAVGSSSGGVAATTVSTAATLRASKRSYGNPSFDDSMTTPSHPLSFAGLSSFANDRDKIAEEFAAIPRVTASIDELPQGAEVKNRYANVVPLPETRVPLTRIENDPLTEYINASYVRGPKNATKYYIACQAPLESTVADFWRMIWEQRCKVVIMLTDLVENGVEKCAEYIPPSEVTDCHRIFGDFRVTLKKRETKEKYAISTILLKNLENDTFRELWHIWYMWPANGVQSSDAAGLIAVLLEARAFQRGGPAPVLVHCSPGTGRTGTLIALDLAIRQYEITRTVDVPRVVYTIRRDRAGAVRTNEQYAFIYKALNLYATRLAGGAFDS
ncbi:mucin-5AC [Venturia canescens]|uniref:mucin-5AC n=1 Tax=Venturia canescens TaxID=32260 RepID=UPI001C9D5C38|nr:mucin-5AC [Venturia canescens]